jgi:2-polyprenyl-3-methyl-5-hydroxy-6-metoxy-1,4-benzoquinol methylase
MINPEGSQDICLLCSSAVKSLSLAQPGYRLGSSFEILHCPMCDTSFARPMEVDSAIYDAIYAHPDEIPGYDRYATYARTVLEVPDPIAFLSDSEDVYWSIRCCVKQLKPGARILEIGSGLGYMTYALLKGGYDVVGIDISKTAVENASVRYGPHFQEADLAEWSVQKAGEFDMVIMAELIEHIPEPLMFLRMATKLLRPGGRLVVTTPNKSYYPKWMLWESDTPPVHLWWFSETSMKLFAKELGLTIEFVDFTPFNREHPTKPIARIIMPDLPTQGAKLDEWNRPLSPEAVRRVSYTLRPPFYVLRKLQRSTIRRFQSLKEWIHPTRPGRLSRALCAVLLKQE